MHQQQTVFENIVGKGEIAHNEQFLLFPQCFLLMSNQKVVAPMTINLQRRFVITKTVGKRAGHQQVLLSIVFKSIVNTQGEHNTVRSYICKSYKSANSENIY